MIRDRLVASLLLRGALLCSLLGPAAGIAHAQERAAADSGRGDTVAAPPPSPGSPRAALEQYFRLTRTGRYAEAARYLDLSGSGAADAGALARQLRAVLDRSVWIELDEVSGAASGDTADGLPRSVEEIGTIVDSSGVRAPVRLSRSGTAEVP